MSWQSYAENYGNIMLSRFHLIFYTTRSPAVAGIADRRISRRSSSSSSSS